MQRKHYKYGSDIEKDRTVEKVGDVLYTAYQKPLCTCGKEVVINRFGMGENMDFYIGFCDCKNILVAQFPQKYN